MSPADNMASPNPDLSIYIKEVSRISAHLYRNIQTGKVAAPPDCPKCPAMPLDPERINDAVLALLSLGLHENQRALKTFDWDAMNPLHTKSLMQGHCNH